MLLVIVKLLSERRDWNELKEQVQACPCFLLKKMVGAVMEVWEAGKAEEDEREGLTVSMEGRASGPWQSGVGTTKQTSYINA
ncbi:hypothetical protein BT69DRAFT_1282512 [Atractiella rhizophila]|nr:hypothetical protein BT69DRAFT_1282512 [Atractiella rhizophila]